MNECARCGACTAVCPLYLASGRESLTARGKLHLLDRLSPGAASRTYADILSKCLLCGACTAACPRKIDTPALITRARRDLNRQAGRNVLASSLAGRLLARPNLLAKSLRASAAAGDLLARVLPPGSGLRLKLGLLARSESRAAGNRYVTAARDADHPGAEVAYFAGCWADHLQQPIALATERLTTEATGAPPQVPREQACCGQAALASGNFEQARELARQNIAAFESRDLPILTSCASCYRHLLSYPELLQDEPDWQERALAFSGRLLEFSTFFGNRFACRTPGFRERQVRVFYHDPCHLRFGRRITAPPRNLLVKAHLPPFELPTGPQCCGQGGLFHLAQPELAEAVRSRLLSACAPLAADYLTTTCSGCLLHLQEGLLAAENPARVRHLAEVLVEGLI